MSGVIQIDDIAAVKALRIEDEIGRVVQWNMRKSVAGRRDYWACCPFHNERSPSFHVMGAEGYFKCFGCGAKGDVIEFFMRHDGTDFQSTVNRLLGRVPSDPAQRAAAAARYRAEQAASAKKEQALAIKKRERALSLIARAKPVGGSLVVNYWAARGLHLDAIGLPQDVGFIAGLEYWAPRANEDRTMLIGHFPAKIAAMRDRAGEIQAAHVTYLAKDGSGKAEIIHPQTGEFLPSKKIQGAYWGCAIRLYPEQDILAVGEGIESSLSVRQRRPDIAVWAAGSLGNLAGGGCPKAQKMLNESHRRYGVQGRVESTPVPDRDNPGLVLPPDVKTCLIIADNDGHNPAHNRAMINRARTKFAGNYPFSKRVGVIWPERGLDANDMVQDG
jgi:hypothetical protein